MVMTVFLPVITDILQGPGLGHSGPGGLKCAASGAGQFIDSIAVYSFALKPEEHQPHPVTSPELIMHN